MTDPNEIREEAEQFISEHSVDRPMNEQNVVAAILKGTAVQDLWGNEVLPDAAKWYVINHCVEQILDGMAEAAVADGDRYNAAADGSLIFRGKDPEEVRKQGKEFLRDLKPEAREAID